jgi:phosphohistidine swiveling domain-containing protein
VTKDVQTAVLAIEASKELPPLVGGKALGLRDIARSGLPVPPAWVVLPGVSNGPLSELAATLSARGITRVAVRSSAADEDGGRHSFAGIHETELAVPLEGLGAAVAAVSASAQGERTLAYRRQHGLPPASGPCAVVVQAMVEAEWAGVAFGRGEGVLVEAVEGLGEVAVNGDATPETIELTRAGASWRVVRRWPRRQAVALRSALSGVERVELTGARPELPEWLALEIAAGVATLERARGMSLDVEWAARGEHVAFLQARPQTRPLVAGLPPGEVWTRTNVRELSPEIGSALGASVVLRPFDVYFRGFFRRMGVPLPEHAPVLAIVAGRGVANERMFCGIGDVLGVPRAWMQVLQGAAGEGTNALAPVDPWKLLRRLDVVLRLSAFGVGAERKARRHLAAMRVRRQARAAAPPSGLSDAEIASRVRRVTNEEVVEILEHVNRVAVAFNQNVSGAAMALRAHAAPAALVARLLDPRLVSVTTRQLEEHVEIARAMRRWEGASRFLGTIGPEHAARDHWQHTLPSELWDRVDRWLDAYGHRPPFESELALPRIAEDLRLLASALRPLVLGRDEPESVEARRERRRVDAEAAWAEVARCCGRLARLRVQRPVRDLGRFMLLREQVRSEWMRDWAQARRDLLELARRLVARGSLDVEDDVFNLTIDDLERALRDPSFDARSAVARQRARIAAWRRIEVPNRFTSEEAAAFPRRGLTHVDAGTLLRGTAVSPGEVEGRACVLRSPGDESKMRPGGILVAPATDPGWTPLFARAAGVVVELGGVMSHSATVTREYGLPCVSNVDGAIERLRDGDLLRVDGTHGTVEILQRADRDQYMRPAGGVTRGS